VSARISIHLSRQGEWWFDLFVQASWVDGWAVGGWHSLKGLRDICRIFTIMKWCRDCPSGAPHAGRSVLCGGGGGGGGGGVILKHTQILQHC
jgi:hypothetical protein